MSSDESSTGESRSGQAARLYRKYGPVVYRRCLRLLRDRAAAQDATQEVFVKLLGHLEALDGRATLLPWIYRVATNHCLNVHRARSVRAEGSGEGTGEADPEAPDDWSPDALIDAALVRSVLSRFDARTQAVAVGIFVDGMEQAELAAVLGMSTRSVSRRADRFVREARRFLTSVDAAPALRRRAQAA
jgi:RNA polymerase sigma-70 factor (ECF subfamily)